MVVHGVAVSARRRGRSGHTWLVFRWLLLTAVVAAVWSAAGQASAAAPVGAAAATGGSCPVLKLNAHGRLTPLRTRTYVYRYGRARRHGRTVFLRRVVAVRRTVTTSCVHQCVRMVKRGGRYRSVFVHRLVSVRVRSGNRIVIVRRRRAVYHLDPCTSTPMAEPLGAPVSMALLPGSAFVLDTGVAKQLVAVSGTLRGFAPGPVLKTGDVQMQLTRGTLQLARTPLILDTACGGRSTASIRTGTPATATIDPTSQSTTTLLGDGTVTAIANLQVHLPLELRNNDTGCDAPYITTGYTEFDMTLALSGHEGPSGLANVALTSAADQTSIGGCLSPGISTQPCNGFQFPLSFLISAQLQVAVTLPGR